MTKYIKKSALVLLFFLIFSLFININLINADTIKNNKDETIEIMDSLVLGDASYVKASEVEHKTLEFGLKYVHDKGYVSTNKSSDIMGYAAGGDAYKASGTFKTNTYYGNDIRFLDIDSNLGIEVVPWVKFTNGKWTLNTVTAMAKDFESMHEGYKVIGAINGDFFDISSKHNYNYTSTGGTVALGNYYKVSSTAKAIGFKDGTLIGDITPQVSDKPRLEFLDEKDNIVYQVDVDKINSEPGENETSVYMAFYNTDHTTDNFDIENAYLINVSRFAPFSTSSIYGLGEVDGLKSGEINNKVFAIKTNNNEVKERLVKGATVRVQYYYTGELADYDNVIGAGDTVLLNGECVAPTNYRHPRTFVGVREDGSIILMEVDGRQANIDCYGCTLKEEAAIMKYYGAVAAFNLDGGGSSTICILEDGEFKIKNVPSDGHPRSDSNCLLVVVKVPILKISSSEIKLDSFKLKVDVMEMIEQYKDLYICLVDRENEYIKVNSGEEILFEKLTSNTKYIYAIYAKVNDEYLLLPYTGILTTAKEKYALKDVKIKLINDEYVVTFGVDDKDNTLVNVVLVINGKRFTTSKNEFKVSSIDYASPLTSNARFEVTYNLGDNEGGRTDKFMPEVNEYNKDIIFASALDEIDNYINNLFN